MSVARMVLIKSIIIGIKGIIIGAFVVGCGLMVVLILGMRFSSIFEQFPVLSPLAVYPDAGRPLLAWLLGSLLVVTAPYTLRNIRRIFREMDDARDDRIRMSRGPITRA